ncbi:MAG: prolipoprotein diacylglyceryl transferase [Bacteroidales bacterium]|nr:prolipoprotein diacylglyceryl transferase [Bacteroidales bacterium]
MNHVLLSVATIGDALRELLGWNVTLPIQTYGFFVAMAFLTGAYIMNVVYRRMEAKGLVGPVYKVMEIGQKVTFVDLAASFLVAFVIGYKLIGIVVDYKDFAADAQNYLISTRGSWLGLLIAFVSVYLTYRDRKKKELPSPKKVILRQWPHQLAANLLIVTGIFGLFGAKIFHNFENWDRFVADPIGELTSFSGLTFFGGLIVGGFAGAWYLRKNKLSSFHTLDCAACGIPFGYAMGRIGCQLSGDGCWGIENTSECPAFLPEWAWKSTFPHNVINAGAPMSDCGGATHCHELATSVYPTSLYETIMMLIIFSLCFFWLNKKVKFPGMLFGIYLTLQGVERLLIESIRVNNKFHVFGMEVTQAQMIATGLIIAGGTIIFLTWKYKDRIAEMAKYKEDIPNIKADIVDRID